MYPNQGGYGGPPPLGYPPQQQYQQPGMPQPNYSLGFENLSLNSQPGYPPQGAPPQQPGYPPQGGAPYGAPPTQQGGYGQPPQGGYGGGGGFPQVPPASQPFYQPYGAPPAGGMPGYGAPPAPQGGYNQPPQMGYGGAAGGYGGQPQQAAYGGQQPYQQQPQQMGGGGYQQPYGGTPQPVNPSAYGAPATASSGHLPPPTMHSTPSAPAQRYHGTVKAASPFHADEEAQVLRKAMKGMGTDEASIIAVLSRNSNPQRIEIRDRFKAMYGKDLLKELKSELSGRLEDITLALFTIPAEFDAQLVHKAIQGFGTDEDSLIEILCSRSNAEIRAMKEWYKKLYKKDMESAIRSDTSGHFERILVSLSSGARDEGKPLDMASVQRDADTLHAAGPKKMGTDESEYNRVIASKSYEHVAAVCAVYEQKYGKSLVKVVDSEFSGDIKKAHLSVIRCCQDRAGFFADQLYKSMKGLGTNDRQLTRVVVTRCEKDMVQIKQAFSAKYGKTLDSFIQDDCSGDYGRMLLALVRG